MINLRLIHWYGSRIFMQSQLSRACYDQHLIPRVINCIGRHPMHQQDLKGTIQFELAPLDRELVRARSVYEYVGDV